MDYFQLLCVIGALLFAIYYYLTLTFDTWKNRGIPGPKPTIFFGNFQEVILKKISLAEKTKQLYQEYKNELVFGVFQGRTPILVINDLEMIKDVLIRDFSVFPDRGIHVNPKVEPIFQTLFSLKSKTWRPLRMKLSPVFTSGKLKDMFPLILDCAKNLEEFVEKVRNSGEPVDCRDMAAKFTTDVIGSCAFGVCMNSLSPEGSEFRRMGEQLGKFSFKKLARDFTRLYMPFLFDIIGGYLQSHEVNNFFINLIRDSIKYRQENNVYRPDFVNTLKELKEHPEKLENIELTDALLTSQALVFFLAGFETSSTTISNALYELAQNPEMQDKLRKEIKEVYENNGGALSYTDVKEMKYLDKVFKETLRKYPVLAALSRQATENYTFKDTKIKISKGTRIWIPVYGIQHDPNIYPEPEVFDPERFEDDAFTSRHPMTYLPFGDGPRNCIGARFAHYQSKVGLITILRNNKVEVCAKTLIPYKSEPRNILMIPKGGKVELRITKV